MLFATSMRILASMPAVLWLASCASLPPMEIIETGHFPPPAGYQIASEEPGTSSTFVTAVAAELGDRGFTRTEHPKYFVQVADSDLPGGAGLFLPDAPPDEHGERQWLGSPTGKRSIETRSLAISITDIASGREIYRVHGAEPHRSGQEGGEMLISAVLAQLPPR